MPRGIPGLLACQNLSAMNLFYYLITFTRGGLYATGTNVLLAHD
jgi:hypothetical protein